MKTAIFLLLLNYPDGTQQTVYSVNMPEAACITIMHGIWANPENPIVYVTDDYDVPLVDAACVPLDDMAATFNRESE